ncbi:MULTISPECIES: SDR family NAD(P)-dependent oxidoreductase [Providencia]|uniref:SDR family NAD(P)-dependent oxidoreductase n=1 Tax=Providencia TaxID=586 RepID=UPI001B3938EB|nr:MULTISPECIES: SDR family NAD(P)-dependent oxidoreductase [Providencia]MBQ0365015.1 SDR family NAD(P)-dependent oxidoreductase [Providencia rettgeri]
MRNKHYAVITGASSGIGRAISIKLAERGFNIIAVARRDSLLNELKIKLRKINQYIEVVTKSCDLSITDDAISLYEELKAFDIRVWVNNAGVGYYGEAFSQPIKDAQTLLNLNINTLAVLSLMFVRDNQNIDDSQLINVSSAGGYTIVPTAVTYCASKFFVSSFTEGLAHELLNLDAKVKVKLLAPAATKTDFGRIANGVEYYDYDKVFGTYHSSEELADFFIQLYDSNNVVGYVDRESFSFKLLDNKMPYANNNKFNQKI